VNKMNAVIVNYRRGRHTIYSNQFIVRVQGVEEKESAGKLVGRKVVWRTPGGKKIVGRIASTHGNKGALRAVMEKGLPGQALGTQLEVI